MQNTARIVLFQSPPEACSYLQDHTARNVYADPFRMPSAQMYNLLIQKGFRRSGHHIYRPHCDNCEKCISIRIPVDEFKANRSQQRAINRNRDLTTHAVPGCYTDEYFNLYKRYLNSRHKDAGMDQPEKADFERFLICDWCETLFFELRLDDELIAVAVTDKLSSGLSAVYTYYHPEMLNRSLGTAAILFQIELARELNLPHLYLGYWIDESSKMNYKSNFRPQQRYIADNWIRADRNI